MNGALKALKPENVFTNFEKLTEIPRESGNEAAVANFLVDFAKKLNFEVIKEPCNNIIIKKPATAGYENSQTVILQGHMDMVCVKEDDCDFDFATQAIPLVIDGDFIKTKGTTLGADNGIAVAMMMSILESKSLEHPPLVMLFTVAEETGMDGVLALNPKNVKGDILINIDSEEEGTFLTSCAGGVDNVIQYEYQQQDSQLNKAFKLTVQGLKGGHSGIEINKNRANALKIMGRILRHFETNFDYELATINGGEKMNAIAKKATCTFKVNDDDVAKLKSLVNDLTRMFKREFETSDGDIEIVLEGFEITGKVMTKAATNDITTMLRLVPFGVQTMSASIAGLVESSNNLGVLEQKDSRIVLTCAIRSSVKSLKDEINDRIAIIANCINAKNELVADYPEWQYKTDSPIREIMKKVYLDIYKQDAKIEAIHAGLECGFLKEKVGDIDMISIGPNLYDVHTPKEKLSISSTKRVYEFLIAVLKVLK